MICWSSGTHVEMLVSLVCKGPTDHVRICNHELKGYCFGFKFWRGNICLYIDNCKVPQRFSLIYNNTLALEFDITHYFSWYLVGVFNDFNEASSS